MPGRERKRVPDNRTDEGLSPCSGSIDPESSALSSQLHHTVVRAGVEIHLYMETSGPECTLQLELGAGAFVFLWALKKA